MDAKSSIASRLRGVAVMALAVASVALAMFAVPVIIAPAAHACISPAGGLIINGVVTADGTCGCPPGSSPQNANPDFQCEKPDGTPTDPQAAQAAPVDQVRMNITTSLGKANVVITNLSTVAGTCAYQANYTAGILPSVHREVNLAAKGTATINDLLAPPLLSTYHVVLSCKGDFNGSQVEFGHVEQDVSSF